MDQELNSCSKPSVVMKNPCLKSTMEKLFEKRSQTGDIQFIVDGEVIHAHRCVLAALSPRYEAQFYGSMPREDTIIVEDISPGAFKEFLQFFYMEDVTLTLDNIEDVLNLAKQSLVNEFVAGCTIFFINVIGMDKLLWCYQLARTYDVKALEAYCAKHIGVNIKSVFKTADFLSCDHDMLCRILNFDSLNCKETDVFDACIAWARAQCKRDEIDAADTANLRLALGEAFVKIRFCSMSSEEFAVTSRQYADLLSAQESIEVFEAIVLKANGVHSNIFGVINSISRGSIQACLECSLAVGPRIPFTSQKGECYIEFTTDKAIMLNGFILCNKIDAGFRMAVKVLKRQLSGTIFTKKIRENETKIAFQPPIQIQPNEHSMIIVQSDAFKRASSGLHGFALEKRTSQNGVSFAITPSSNPSLIKGLLFDIVEKP